MKGLSGEDVLTDLYPKNLDRDFMLQAHHDLAKSHITLFYHISMSQTIISSDNQRPTVALSLTVQVIYDI